MPAAKPSALSPKLLIHSAALPPSALLNRAPVTALNLEGYGLAFVAVLYYNYAKLKSMQQAAAAPIKPEGTGAQGEEGERLLNVGSTAAPISSTGSSGGGGGGSGQVQLATPRRLQAGS